MKVALVIFKFIDGAGGVERYCVRFARMLREGGHEVHIFCAKRDGFAGEGFIFHDVPVTRGFSPLTIKSFADNSASMLRREKFDIVHGFSRTYCQDIYRIGGGTHRTYLARTRPWTTGAPGRAVLALNPRHRVIFELERRRYSRENYIRLVAISLIARDEVVSDYGVPPEDVVVIHNAVDNERFSAERLAPLRAGMRSRLGIAEGETLFLFLGTGWARKGLGHLIEGFAMLDRDADARLLVVGRGSVEKYAAMGARIGVSGKIIFLGETDAQSCCAAADAFVFPTLHDGFGTVALEAMASGLPLVCSAKAGASEIITDGEDGVIIPDPTNPAALKRAMDALLEPSARERLGGAARITAGRYSFAENYRRNMEVYAEVLAIKKGREG